MFDWLAELFEWPVPLGTALVTARSSSEGQVYQFCGHDLIELGCSVQCELLPVSRKLLDEPIPVS